MSTSPYLSVVIPTYNRRDLLARTLPTVFAQDFPAEAFEVIVVDDGSTDGTAELLRSLQPPCGFRALAQPNRGQAAARNAGLRAAHGDLVLFLDDDLLCDPSLLKAHAEGHSGENPHVVVGSMLVAPDSASGLVTDWMRVVLDHYFERLAGEATLRWPQHVCAGPNCSAPRATLLATGGYDEQHVHRIEDIELGLRLWTMGVRFRFQPTALAHHITLKSRAIVVREDARVEGRSMLNLCRQHPDYRPHSPFDAFAVGAPPKRLLRAATARIPFLPDLVIDATLSVAERLRAFAAVRRLAVHLLQFRRASVMLRSARQATGSWEVLRREFGLRLPVLLYHHVGPPRPMTYPNLTVSPEQFERQIRWLAHHGYVAVRPSDWLAWLRSGRALPAKAVLLTFDDGYADIADYALPLLERYRFGAAVFVVTGPVGKTNVWDESKGSGPHRLMTAEQIRHWAARGVEFGSHSRTHRDLTTLTASELSAEVEASREDLAALLGSPVVSFAYPYGSYNSTVRDCAAQAYDLAFACEEGVNTLSGDRHLVCRTMVVPGDTWIDFACRVRFGWNPIQHFRSRLRPRARLRSLVGRLRGR